MRTFSTLAILLAVVGCKDATLDDTGQPVDADGDGHTADLDCDDDDPLVGPGADERCNGVDDDCNGVIDDDPVDGETWYADADGDGFGGATSVVACEAPAGYVATSGDCDDADAAVKPGADELCNGIDDDCDGKVDNDAIDGQTYYGDMDGDGFGDPDVTAVACSAPTGHVALDTDCDDGDANVNPGADELCNGVDDDCDGEIDEGASGTAIFYADADADGFGDPAVTATGCSAPEGYVALDTDCDDTDPAISPAAVEVCDGVDANCDGVIDGPGAWWDPAWPYRVAVDVSASGFAVDAATVAVTVDFGAALDGFGDASSFAPDSIRVVLAGCQAEVPSQFLDDRAGVFEKRSDLDPVGDAHGTVAFHHDTDGDASTVEALPAGESVRYEVYFASVDTLGDIAAPSYASGLQVTDTTLENETTEAVFDADFGGLLASLHYEGSFSLISQTESASGNSMFTNVGARWSIDPQDAPGTLEVVASGPILAGLRASGARGNDFGNYEYSYTYWLTARRPELWTKVHQVTTSEFENAHPDDMVNGIRPWQSRHTNLVSSATEFVIGPDASYGGVSDGGLGVSFGYHQAPAYIIKMTNPFPGGLEPKSYMASFANDYADIGLGTPHTLPAGAVYMDNPVWVVMPHAGDFDSVSDTFFGLLDGVETVLADPEAL